MAPWELRKADDVVCHIKRELLSRRITEVVHRYGTSLLSAVSYHEKVLPWVSKGLSSPPLFLSSHSVLSSQTNNVRTLFLIGEPSLRKITKNMVPHQRLWGLLSGLCDLEVNSVYDLSYLLFKWRLSLSLLHGTFSSPHRFCCFTRWVLSLKLLHPKSCVYTPLREMEIWQWSSSFDQHSWRNQII